MRRPLAWAGIALVNLSAMTLFLWHQTAFITVSSVGLLAGCRDCWPPRRAACG